MKDTVLGNFSFPSSIHLPNQQTSSISRATILILFVFHRSRSFVEQVAELDTELAEYERYRDGKLKQVKVKEEPISDGEMNF